MREKHGQKQTDRGACWGDVDTYSTQTTGKPVLTGVPGTTRHPPRRLPTTPSPKAELEASGAGASVLDVTGVAQALDRKGRGEEHSWVLLRGLRVTKCQQSLAALVLPFVCPVSWSHGWIITAITVLFKKTKPEEFLSQFEIAV